MNVTEKFYRTQYNNVVLTDNHGIPSVFVRHPKQYSNEFSNLLPAHVHPAFVIDNTEQAAILIGKYDGCKLENDGTIYSLPNMVPDGAPSNGPTMTDCLTRMRKLSGQSGLTIADYGLLTLMAEKYNLDNSKEPCDGNLNGGGSPTVASAWTASASVTVGAQRIYRGWLYTCLTAHTTSTSILPDSSPVYWRKERRVGGIPDDTSFANHSNLRGFVLTGSGPKEWYWLHDINNEVDLKGNGYKMIYGVRLYNGEINILPNNDAANPSANVFTSSTAWKAILPHSGDTGYDLVAPGTAGTVHFRWTGSGIEAVGRALESSELVVAQRLAYFRQITADSTTLPYVPYILYELGLLPLPNITLTGIVKMWIMSGEVYMIAGNSYGEDIYSGWGAYCFNMTPTVASQAVVPRPRAIES